MTGIEQARRDLEQALATFERERASLYRNGKKIYADDEHARRERALLEPVRAAVAAVQAAAEEERVAVRRELTRIDSATPLDGLTAEELERASRLAGFVREDAETLPLRAFAQRLSGVEVGDDRVAQALYARYGSARLRRVQQDTRSGSAQSREDAQWVAEVDRLVSALEAATVDRSGHAAAQDRLRAADELLMEANRRLAEVDGSLERSRQAMLARGLPHRR